MTLDKLDSKSPQCQFFVVRKKRLCRMTVRPGRNYCGEHQPQPALGDVQDETRVPCPNDPKHTCYASKLARHLSICNARQQANKAHIQHNVNAPPETGPLKRPLAEVSHTEIRKIIDKIDQLFKKHLENTIEILPEKEIHPVVMTEFEIVGRTESSLRHLRQASRLMYIMEEEGLVTDGTCYVELGAGKGHLSYFAWQAWCASSDGSSVLLVERASLRHKRDNKIRDILRDTSHQPDNPTEINQEPRDGGESSFRLRADLAHLVLHAVPAVQQRAFVVGFAKHLCGVATDYSLRCLTSTDTLHKARGAVIATCCHHRCQPDAYVGGRQLSELGIDREEFNILLGVVSWATCGDGRSRDGRESTGEVRGAAGLTRERREEVGRKAKALLDWGRVMYLKECGFRARLCQYVPTSVSLENICIVAEKSL